MTRKQQNYLEVRIDQLKEDQQKCNDPYDKMWYNRLIQELDWAQQMNNKPTHNCFMGSNTTGEKEIWT